MKRIIVFLSVLLLAIFLAGCGGGDDGGKVKTDCCPIYETDDAVAWELLGRPGWEEVCEDVRRRNLFGRHPYIRGLCYAPGDADSPVRRLGGSDSFGLTCEQCVQGAEERGERRIWVPCDEKAVPCWPELKNPKEREIPEPDIPSYCYPWGEPVERCGFLERLFGDCPQSYKTCYRFPDRDALLEDDEGRRYLWACQYPGSLRPPGNEGCGSDAPEDCNWPPPGSPGGYYWDRPFHIIADPFCETLVGDLE